MVVLLLPFPFRWIGLFKLKLDHDQFPEGTTMIVPLAALLIAF